MLTPSFQLLLCRTAGLKEPRGKDVSQEIACRFRINSWYVTLDLLLASVRVTHNLLREIRHLEAQISLSHLKGL